MTATDRAFVTGREIWKIFGRDARAAFDALARDNLPKHELQKRFGVVVGVAGVNFDVRRGEIFCIMGLSGSGKSTLIRHVNRLIEPTAGQVLIDGEDIGRISQAELRHLRARKISMVFQGTGLFPHWTTRDNVAFGLEVQGVPRARRLAIAQEKLELVQLGQWADHYPSELSGGMQQRVGLARALANDPELILMDEPFSALDPLIRRQLQDEFLSIWKTLNKTALFITHDLDEAIRIGDRIAIMKEGQFVQVGTPEEIVTRPMDDYVRAFVQGISKLKFVRAHSLMRSVDAHRGMNGHAIDSFRNYPRVREDTLLDHLIELKVKSADFDPFAVVDGEDRIIGVITMADILAGVRAAPDRPTDQDQHPASHSGGYGSQNAC
ncbi:MAG: glycine betaine/L-proline ABC transporter ATP-binding protein [Parvibaculaceae bacterium]